MRRILVASVLSAAVLLSGCQKSESADFRPADVKDKLTDGITLPEMVDASDGAFYNKYDIDKDKVAGYVALFCSSGATADEVVLIELNDKADVPEAVEQLRKRKKDVFESFENYVPSEVPRIKSALIISKEKYVLYAVCDDTDKLSQNFEGLFNDK